MLRVVLGTLLGIRLAGRLAASFVRRLLLGELMEEALLADGQQLVVRALLHHTPLVDDGDLVGATDRRETVSDHDRRALLLSHDLVESRLHDALALVVERRRRLV